jgi:hypothetical protein
MVFRDPSDPRGDHAVLEATVTGGSEIMNRYVAAWLVASSVACATAHQEKPMASQPLVTRELQIVDEHGRPRLVLGATEHPSIRLLGEDGAARAEIRLDPAGRPAVALSNPDAAGPVVALEVDDKGAHVKFDRPGGASSYVFLNNAGGSGLVLIDAQGIRRLSVMLDPSGAPVIQRFDDDGKPTQ